MTRLPAAHRRAQIVAAARALSAGGRLYDWTFDDVAEFVGVSRPTIQYYFFNAPSLRREVVCKAIRERDVPIVLQALARHDPLVDDVDPELRQACAAAMI